MLQFEEGGGPATRGHKYKLKKKRWHSRLRQNFCRGNNQHTWSSLLAIIVEPLSIIAFKKRLENFGNIKK